MEAFIKYKRSIMLLAFVCPALLFYSVFVLAPAFGGVWYSMTDWNGLNKTYQMVGLANYKEALMNDKYFLNSIWFTVKYVVVMVVLQNGLAIILAVFIETKQKTKSLLRTIFFMPNMISLIVGGFMWLFVFTKVFPYLAEHAKIAFLDQSWIGNPSYSFIAILILSLWAGVGYLMVIYIAALQNVPDDMKEAAEIDGASSWQTFRYITVPMILPAVTIGIFLTLNGSFKVFDAVYSLTGGGPGRSTQVIALNIFEEAFAQSNRYGYASAKAIILFLIVMLITFIQLAVMKKKEVEV